MYCDDSLQNVRFNYFSPAQRAPRNQALRKMHPLRNPACNAWVFSNLHREITGLPRDRFRSAQVTGGTLLAHHRSFLDYRSNLQKLLDNTF